MASVALNALTKHSTPRQLDTQHRNRIGVLHVQLAQCRNLQHRCLQHTACLWVHRLPL